MAWTTLYVQGKPGFETEVLRHLEQSDLAFMPGSASGEPHVCLFWIDEQTTIRDFKKAIGSKTIFKYRINVFTSLESLHVTQAQQAENFLTPQEEALIRSMSEWQENQVHYKYTA